MGEGRREMGDGRGEKGDGRWETDDGYRMTEDSKKYETKFGGLSIMGIGGRCWLTLDYR
jgi:hypothetical protein